MNSPSTKAASASGQIAGRQTPPSQDSSLGYWQPAPAFDQASIRWLQQHLPPFSLEPTPDDWVAPPQLQAYLDFYQINFTSRLAATHRFGYLDWRDYRIALHCWQPAAPRGTLVIVHGYYDHTGIFARAIEFGLAQQLAVVIFDLPGHGLSSGERSAIASFDIYGDLLEQVLSLSLAQLPRPCFALGQSTGGAILLNHLWRYPQQAAQLHKIALCAPLILPRGWGAGRLLYWLVRPFIRRLKRGRSLSSHDLAFVSFIEAGDPLQDKTLSLQWVGAMKAWHEYFRQLPLNDRELLVLQGTGDMTVDWRYNLPLLQQKLPNAGVEYLPDAGHQLVNESDKYRLPLFARLANFFVAQD